MQIKTIYPDEYPYLLRQIPRPPDHLDVAGTMPDDKQKFLCVIGSRTHSSYGLDVCKYLLKGLAGYPIVIVSGLAIGIDSMAHETALETGLKTVAFPGSGLAETAIYPSSKRSLAHNIVKAGGAVVSEFDYNQLGAYWTFPSRNRLMAGISHATLIIEARQGSGTLITVEFVVQFNRDMLVVPGSILSDLSYGPHMLMRQGATPVTSPLDILEALGYEVDRSGSMAVTFDESLLSPEQKLIVSLLRSGPHTSTEIIEKTRISVSNFNISSSQLELAGILESRHDRYKLRRVK